MPIYLWQRSSPCPIDAIELYENSRAIRMPSLLRDFLIQNNGAEADDVQSMYLTKSAACPFSDFMLASILGLEQILKATEHLGEMIPRSGIPFAEDALGASLIVDSDTEEIDLVNLDPNDPTVDIGCFPTGSFYAIS